MQNQSRLGATQRTRLPMLSKHAQQLCALSFPEITLSLAAEVVVNRGGVSWTHLELLVSTDAHDNAILEVKDTAVRIIQKPMRAKNHMVA
eukprot:1754343-Amphidinium_carterae.1